MSEKNKETYKTKKELKVQVEKGEGGTRMTRDTGGRKRSKESFTN